MKACIISIGDEVLNGQVVNTNASFLASRLVEEGFTIESQIVVSDYDLGLDEKIIELAKFVDLIICTGGLGPTVDDLTRHLFAKLSGSELIFDQHIYDDLQNRYNIQPYHRLQAMIPEKAIKLKNAVGQAPGLLVDHKSCKIVALPGVPHEMKNMFDFELIPYLKKAFALKKKLYEKKLYFFDIIEVKIDPFLKELIAKYPQISAGIYPSYGTLRVVLKGPYEFHVIEAANLLKAQFQSHVFESPDGSIEKGFYELCKKKHMTFAFAESITGGALSSRIVHIPGVSSYYLGSIVSYANQIKSQILKVSETVLGSHGAVSRETAEMMLSGVFQELKSDIGCAITGIAGPDGGTASKPVGLVYIACGFKGRTPVIHRMEFKGDRLMIIEKAVVYALGYLYQLLDSDKEFSEKKNNLIGI